jgi:beta-glucanase (GH16 family)
MCSQICKASNEYGDQKLEIHLTVHDRLSVEMKPQQQYANYKSNAIFNCTITGAHTFDIEWFHNGDAIKYRKGDGNDEKY